MKIQKVLFLLLCLSFGSTSTMFRRAPALLFSRTSNYSPVSSGRTYKCLVTSYTSESFQARAAMKKAYLDMFRKAQRRDKVYGAFFMVTDKDILLAATCAKARGVDVRFVVDYSTVLSSAKVAQFLTRRNVPVFVYRDSSGAFMHTKFLTDGRKTLLGSANATPCAFNRHVEDVEKVENYSFAQQKLRYFACILEEIKKQEKEKRHLDTKSARDWCALKIAYKERMQGLRQEA